MDIYDLNISGNINVWGMFFSGESYITIDSVQIKNNIIHGSVYFRLCHNFLIENNTILGGLIDGAYDFKIIKNRITGNVSTAGNLLNNFIIGKLLIYPEHSYVINNTIVGGSIDTPTVSDNIYYKVVHFLNNIVINPAGGTAIDFHSPLESDYNVFFNGGNSNLINYQGTTYNNVQDFYNATGLDQHTTSQPVTFVSSTDLHLAGSSIGDIQLVGIPNSLISDDIDGELRDPLYPYKGADENLNVTLPVELSAFSYTANGNNVYLNWVTTSELNNAGFDIERSKVNAQITGRWLNIGFVQGRANSSNINLYEYNDKGLNPGKYNYRLKQIDYNGNFTFYNLSEEVIIGAPEHYFLNQNFPNPFNPVTVISYQIAVNDNVNIKIFDVNGKEIMTLVNEFKEAGKYEVIFNGNNLASGVYYYRIKSGDFKATKKMFLVK